MSSFLRFRISAFQMERTNILLAYNLAEVLFLLVNSPFGTPLAPRHILYSALQKASEQEQRPRTFSKVTSARGKCPTCETHPARAHANKKRCALPYPPPELMRPSSPSNLTMFSPTCIRGLAGETYSAVVIRQKWVETRADRGLPRRLMKIIISSIFKFNQSLNETGHTKSVPPP
jgi:hypothetical protein